MAKQAQLDEVRPVLNKANKVASRVSKAMDVVEAGADKATDILEDGLEVVADVVPEVLDSGVHVAAEGVRAGTNALTNPKRLAVLLGIGGAVLGAGLGVAAYFALKRKLEAKYRAELEEQLKVELASMETYFQRRFKAGKFASPEAAAEAAGLENKEAIDPVVDEAVTALETYEGDQPPPGIVDKAHDPRAGANARVRYDQVQKASEKFVAQAAQAAEAAEDVVEEVRDAVAPKHNVFDNARRLENWDQDAEEAQRNPEAPYIISHDEYMENAYEHEQNSLTYYAGDDILCDEREIPIDEVESTVGVDNLTMFGHGSRDSSVVYIRNERVEVEFEIVLRPGKYAEEVVGLIDETGDPRLRHGRNGDRE